VDRDCQARGLGCFLSVSQHLGFPLNHPFSGIKKFWLL
jgi:hypothetical protein